MSIIHIQSVTDLIPQTNAFFFDMFGTIWNGFDFYESVNSVFKTLKEAQKKVYILSNATALSDSFFKKTAEKGLQKGIHYDDFITSGDALFHRLTQGFFETICKRSDFRFYVLGRPNPDLFRPIADHQTFILEKAHLIYISGLEIDQIPPLTLDRFLPEAQKALSLKLPCVCANPDYIAFHGKEKYLTGGSLAQWYENQGGKVFWIGKPYPYLFEYALARTNEQANTSVMIGDTLRTDVKGGQDAGFKTVLITKTGVIADELKNGSTLESLYHFYQTSPHFILDKFQ